jgi:hypothetical protein
MHRIVAVTPAGRRHYLELLAHYVLADESITEWQLWDNCRDPADRAYIEALAGRSPKVQLVRIPGSDGGLRAINRFYAGIRDRAAFYIKMDDDLVYLPRGFGAALYRRAMSERGRYAWWSPLVVNNALCTWLLKYHSRVRIDAHVSAQAGCGYGWRSPVFAEQLHRVFLEAARSGRLSAFHVPDAEVSLARFSINCIGLFGEDVAALGEQFCPPEVDDEEWISAVLPSRLGRPGRILGDILVSHFSFFTQERDLLAARVLEEYYAFAGLPPEPYRIRRLTVKRRLRRRLEDRWLGTGTRTRIELPPRAERPPGLPAGRAEAEGVLR